MKHVKAHMIDRRVRYAWLLWLACLTLLQTGLASGQNPVNQQPGEQLQAMFDAFANNAGPLAPMFGKLSPQQLQQLDDIKISLAEENQFGQKVLKAYLQQLAQAQIAVIQQGKDVEYLQQLLEVLKPHMNHGSRYKSFDVQVINVASSDAFSIPGGHLLITLGLLKNAESEATVVGVLAHELSHLDRGHQLLPLKQSKLVGKPLNFADSLMWISLVARPFRPEQESEADSDATHWMMAAGYDPLELAKLLSRWDQQQDQAMPWMQFVPGFVKSHPDAGKRAQEVLKVARQNKARYPQAVLIGTENLAQRKAIPAR